MDFKENEHNFVDCHHCQHWPERNRYFSACPKCHNSKKVIDPKEILCNMCGETMCPIGTMNEQIPHGLYNAFATGGYDSYHLSDMNKYSFNFCEKCLRNLFIQCKIKPNITDVMSGHEESWEEDQKFYEYRIWKDNGGYHQAYLNRKCNFVKDCPNEALYTQLLHNEFTEGCCCEEHKILHAFSNSSLTKFIQNNLKAFL